ncbi:hypothetical protein PF005_g13200 [Phytophthora fragariae]|uniref:Uncharacterized protein n=1 Tax=Phytophthora fragariae TaxID=53985 RepID=A0A6A3RP71_9STRA|nr:hypothetical protein PF007_g15201 [Phytophthora fragariae]KAE9205963.1 hypothetical protein PF005_g13200 [Phytophthora fragariae]
MKIEARYAKAGSEAPASELLKNPEFPLYLVSYLCTHAWEPRNRGSGKRPRRNVRPVGCKAKLHVLQRREGDRSELADVNTLRRVGVARKKILKYIWENTDSEPCMVDVHNLPAKLKKEEEAGSTVSKRLSETLNRFCEEEKYGVAHVDIDRVDNEQSQRILEAIACAFTEGRLDDSDVDVAQLRSGQSGNYELTEAPYRDAQSAEPAESGLETQSAAVTVQEATPTCPEAPVADGGTNSDPPISEVNIDSEPDVVILDDHSNLTAAVALLLKVIAEPVLGTQNNANLTAAVALLLKVIARNAS